MSEINNQQIKKVAFRNRQKGSLLYVALPLSKEVRIKIHEQVERLKKLNYPIHWIESNGAQIMIIVMGTLGTERAQDAVLAIRRVADRWQPFALNAYGLGYYAKERAGGDPSFDGKSRWVVYLDIPDRGKILRAFYKDIFKSLTEEGFFPTLHFNPRITLGSLVEKKGSRENREDLLENLITEEFSVADFLVDRINIYEMSRFGAKLVKGFYLGQKDTRDLEVNE